MAILYEDYIKDKDKYDIYTPPKKKTTKKKKQNTNTLFKKSEGNLGQAIGYSALDALGNVTEGFLKGYEGISDWARNRGADIVDFFGADEYAKELRERSKEDDVADIVKQWNHITSGDLAGTKSEEELGNFKKVKANTVLGDKGGQVFQGIGNSLASLSAGMASGGTLATPSFFMSASGNAETEALNAGATTGEARMYGLLSGTVEALSEKMFGGLGKASEKFGLGKGALDDQITNVFTKNMKSALMKNITTLGLKSVGEGLEEVASGFGNALAQKLTYMNDEEIGQLLKDQNLMDSFVSGMLSSAIMQSPSTVKYTAQGRDINTGLTGTQQKYVNEIAQQRMVEAQKRNAKLNGYEQAKIEQRALTDYQQGRLADSSKLNQINLPGISTKDMDLQQSAYKYGINPNSEAIVGMKTLFDNRDIVGIFDADRFKGSNENAFWSRNENGKREVVLNPNASPDVLLEEIAIHELTHDLMSSENSQEIIDNQKIMDYVSTLDGYEEARAKVEKLYAKQTKGKTAEAKKAYIDEEIVADTLGKNIGSQEYIRRLIDDEPSIAKNIYDWVVNKVVNNKGVKNEKAYWNNVKNNFEKAYNMEYQGKGSEDNTKLSKGRLTTGEDVIVSDDLLGSNPSNEQVKSILEKMIGNKYYNESSDRNIGVDDTSIGKYLYDGYNNPKNAKLKKRIAGNYGEILEIAKINSDKSGKENYKNSNRGKDGYDYYDVKLAYPIKDKDNNILDYRVYTGRLVVRKESNGDFTYDIDRIKEKKGAVVDKNNLSILTDKTANNGSFIATNVTQSDDNVKSDQKFSMSEQLENQASNLVEEDIQITNAMLDNFKSYLEEYDITNPTQEDIDNSLIDLLGYDNDMTPAETLKYEKQYKEVVNEYLKGQKTTTDNQGRELTKEQQEFFKDSKVRDSEGNLKVLYNGSGNHTVYLPGYMSDESHWGKGIYLTPYKDIASEYGNDVKETYVNITKPMSHNTKMPFEQYNDFYKAINDGEEAYQEDYDMYDNDFDLLWDSTNKGSWADYADELKKYTGYDGIIAEEIDGDRTSSMVIAFQSNQIKNVDNTNPTDDPDIRKSQQNKGWQSFLDKNFKPKGTKTRLSDIKLPGLTKAVQEEVKAPKTTKTKNLPLVKEEKVLKLDPNQIADALNGSNKEGLRAPNGKKVRKWSNTSTNSDVLKDFIGIEDLDINKITYVPVSNKKTIDKANDALSRMGYEEAIQHVKKTISEGTASLTDIAIAEELIVEARNRQDTQMVADLLMDVSILGTELGQKVQALSLIKKMTPEGQLKMYQKIITRAKAKGNKGFQDVEITPTMVNTILDAYDKNGNFNQDDLNQRVEVFKQQVAEQMKSTVGEQLDEWRYLSMLGNPKTHIRNIVSNIAMKYTLAVKNAVARTVESVLPEKLLPKSQRTKTWEQASGYIKGFAEQTTEDWKNVISGESKYSETQQLNKMKKTFKVEALNKLSNLNSNLLEVEDWFFSKSAFKKSLQEYLTAQGIKTEQDINNNAEIVEKAKMYALEQAQIATFRQYSWLANKINEIENKNVFGKVVVGGLIPFKKTPINVAKAGIKYSPLGFIKNLIYDIPQLKNGNINASQLIDNVSQSLTGTSLMLLGYALAQAGFITGGGDDDKESKFDSALGNQTYALKFGNNTYSISWLSPVAMPLLVGANAFKEFNEKEEWDYNILLDTLAGTLDPITEMSFVSSLTDALQSYQQGSSQMVKNMGLSVINTATTQFFPTLFSQIASVFDDKKRSTRASGDSKFKYGEELWNQIIYKIPGLRNTLPVATDIWGNEQKQAENIAQRAIEVFIAPYNRKSVSNTALDKEIKKVYSETGDTEVIPGTPKGYIQYKDERYDMNNDEYVSYKKTYGTKANEYLNSLITTNAYKSATADEKSKMMQDIYGYANAYAKQEFFNNRKIEYTSDEVNAIKKFEELNMNSEAVGEFVAINKVSSSIKNNKELTATEKRQQIGEKMMSANLKDNQLAYLYSKYYSSEEKLEKMVTLEIPMKQFIQYDTADIQGQYNTKTGQTISGSKKNAIIEYVNSIQGLTKAQRAIIIKATNTFNFNEYNNDIIRYVNTLPGTVNEKKVLLKSIGFDNYDDDVYNYIISKYKTEEEALKKLDELGFTVRDGRVYY